MSTAIISIALPLDGEPTVASAGVTHGHALPLAQALAQLQAQLLTLAVTPPTVTAAPTPETSQYVDDAPPRAEG